MKWTVSIIVVAIIAGLIALGLYAKKAKKSRPVAAPTVQVEPSPVPAPTLPAAQPAPARTAERHEVITRIPREKAKKSKPKKRVVAKTVKKRAPAPKENQSTHYDWFTGSPREDNRWSNGA